MSKRQKKINLQITGKAGYKHGCMDVQTSMNS